MGVPALEPECTTLRRPKTSKSGERLDTGEGVGRTGSLGQAGLAFGGGSLH